MANIKVNDLLNLNLTGAELFSDSESFLTELNDDGEQINGIYGGDYPQRCVPTTCVETKATMLRTIVVIYAV